MSIERSSRSGAEVLIDALKINAVERVYCIPGESYLAALDALYDRSEISLIVCRNEGGAAFMAEAEGKLSGRPGICFVTRGPGATNASGGLHVAMQDSTPMILLIGQIARKDIDREAFQEIDYRRMFSEVAKWVAQIDDAARIPEYLNRAFSVATSGRPGPVVLALPEDMLTDQVTVGDRKFEGDFGLFLVFRKPNDDGLVGVLGATNAKTMRMAQQARHFISGSACPDYAVWSSDALDVGMEGMAASGWFDGGWKLPE